MFEGEKQVEYTSKRMLTSLAVNEPNKEHLKESIKKYKSGTNGVIVCKKSENCCFDNLVKRGHSNSNSTVTLIRKEILTKDLLKLLGLD